MTASELLREALKQPCVKCKGTGYIDGQHKPGFTHYETDAGEECPAYHFDLGVCPVCHGTRYPALESLFAGLLTERDEARDEFKDLAQLYASRVFDLRVRLEKSEADVLRLVAAIKEYRAWFDTCTKTNSYKWEEAAYEASVGLDAAIAAIEASKPSGNAVRRDVPGKESE